MRSTKAEIDDLFEAATAHIRSVPYQVSLRWLFYRLLQDGFFAAKGDYKSRLVPVASRWRHTGRWPANILTDDTRESAGSAGSGRATAGTIVETFFDAARYHLHRSHFYDQERYIEIWFEAQGMQRQFRYFTDDMVLVPFKGDPSIPYKYEVAGDLARNIRRFGKPATVLYFGDRDDHGEEIFWSAIDGPKGLRKWCAEDFDLVRCGLTAEQAERYDVPENPDKPNDYQWEALTDQAAGVIITEAIGEYIDPELIALANDEANELTEQMEAVVRPVITDALEGFKTE